MQTGKGISKQFFCRQFRWLPQSRTQGSGERCSRPFVLVGLTVFLAGHRQCHQYPERWLSENICQIPKMEQTAEWKKVDPVATGWGGCRCRCRSKRKTDLETGDLDVPCVFAHWNISCKQLPFWMFGAAKGARMGLSVLHAWDVGQSPNARDTKMLYRKILAETPPNGIKEGEVTYSYHDCSAAKETRHWIFIHCDKKHI